jgi:hypothetical protein
VNFIKGPKNLGPQKSDNSIPKDRRGKSPVVQRKNTEIDGNERNSDAEKPRKSFDSVSKPSIPGSSEAPRRGYTYNQHPSRKKSPKSNPGAKKPGNHNSKTPLHNPKSPKTDLKPDKSDQKKENMRHLGKYITKLAPSRSPASLPPPPSPKSHYNQYLKPLSDFTYQKGIETLQKSLTNTHPNSSSKKTDSPTQALTLKPLQNYLSKFVISE